MLIKSISDFRAVVRNGAYAWPGGYPLFWVMADGGACAFNVAKDERRFMLQALADNSRSDQWRPVAIEVNWEDADLRCDATGELIESAYGEVTP
jgi:hypothetical protein